MKKTFRFLFAALALMGIASCADVPELPYPTPDPNGGGGGTTTSGLPFTSASLNDFEVKTVEGIDWSLGSSYAKASGYDNNSKTTTATKAWLVSPAINTTVTGTGTDGVTITFDHELRYVKSSTDLKGWHKVLASKDYAGDVTTATWTDLGFEAAATPNTNPWEFPAANPVHLPAELLNEEKVYIAFYFQCDGTNSTTWELKNFSMQEGMTPDPTPGPEPGEVKAVTIAEFNAAAVSTDVWYELVGTASAIKDGDQYGNFDLTDETGTVYVYGLLAAKDGEKKAFQDLVAKTGLANGDKIKIHGQRGDYQGKIEVLNAYFVEIVEKGGDNPDPGPTPSEALFTADFTSGDNGFSIYNVVIDENLDYVWAVDSKYGWKASAFKDNVRYATDSYIVSPAIDLTSASSATLTFSHVARYFGDSATDFLSVLVTTSFDGDAAKASWVTLTVPSWPSGADWNYIDSGDISLAGYVGNKVYIAFRYTSSSSIAATWEIKSMSIK